MARKVVAVYRAGRRAPSVVLVEPHDDTRLLYRDYLESTGFLVTAVAVGADALKAVRRRTPDAIVTCLRLPRVDGFDLCEALWAMPALRATPIIALCTWTQEYQRALEETRFAVVLMKPCLPDALLRWLRNALAVMSRGDELAASLPSGEATSHSHR